MDVGDKLLLFIFALFVFYGAGGLAATWLLPSLQRTWLYTPWMLTGTSDANNVNRTIMSVFCVLIGAEVGFSIIGERTLRMTALALLVVVVIAKLAYARRHPDA